MQYEQIQDLPDEHFSRLTVVKSKTFEKIFKTLKMNDESKKVKVGHKNKLTLEPQLLITLEYTREYRAYTNPTE